MNNFFSNLSYIGIGTPVVPVFSISLLTNTVKLNLK
jgi:hypothetical protein